MHDIATGVYCRNDDLSVDENLDCGLLFTIKSKFKFINATIRDFYGGRFVKRKLEVLR